MFLPINNDSFYSSTQSILTATSTPAPDAESPPGCPAAVNLTNLFRYRDTYRTIHIYLCLFICPIGVVANILNVIVLNQRVMKSPTNFLLTVLAISDGLIMAFYIPFDVFYLMEHRMAKSDFFGAVYLLFYLNLQNILHAFSSWLIVGLALFRLLYIRLAAQSKALCNMQRARQMVLGVIGGSFILTIPYAVTHVVIEVPESADNVTYYTVDYAKDEIRQKVLFWSSAILLKLLPLILLAILSILLVLTLRSAERRRRQLKNNRRESNCVSQSGGGIGSSGLGSGTGTSRKDGKRQRTKSTTRSLLAIVIIFMIAYLPQAILIFLIGAIGGCLFRQIYDVFGDTLDLLILINNGVNFILYCIMSRQFRDVFAQVFCRRREQTIKALQLTPVANPRITTTVHPPNVPEDATNHHKYHGLNNKRFSVEGFVDAEDRQPLRGTHRRDIENCAGHDDHVVTDDDGLVCSATSHLPKTGVLIVPDTEFETEATHCL